MLERLQTIAKVFSRIRWLLFLLGIVGALGFAASLFELSILQGQQLMMPSLVVLFWASTCLCFISLFSQVPPAIEPDAGAIQRWKRGIHRASYRVLGTLMVLLSLSLVILSYQLIRAWTML
ncbi:MAG: hypothetical protein AB8B95_04290 [Pseudohongiellaceae bacterium]